LFLRRRNNPVVADAADRATAQGEAMEAFLQRRPVLTRSVNAGIRCLACGEEIPEARRRAVPGCCHCVACQDELEGAMGR
jgi:phage/conjugal plasmid C-4 type zinc finger TraR family protein